jgi:hypothetical protein
MAEQNNSAAKRDIRSGLLQRETKPPIVVQYEVIDGDAIFEGDIILGRAEDLDFSDPPVTSAVAISTGGKRWRNGVIPFRFEDGFPDPTPTMSAIQHWEQNTCIRFVERTNEPDFVTFRWRDGGCTSSVGRRGGEQFITLSAGCPVDNVIHEIGHAVGLWHEQSREDRDKFVVINWEGVIPGMEHAVNQHISDGDDIGPYDYDSVMHSDEFDVAITKVGGIPSIIAPRDVGSGALSAGDIAAVRNMYYFKRLSDRQAGTVSEIATIGRQVFPNQQVVTAVRTAADTLKLISWQVNDDGSISRLGDSGDQAGSASDIDITSDPFQVNRNRYVTACRTSAGNLKLISWNISDTGEITRTGDSGDQAGEASLISVAGHAVGTPTAMYTTAVRAGNGDLKLISWRLNDDGSLSRLADSGSKAGEVSEISIVANVQRLVTSVRTGDGNLKLIVWNVSAEGNFERLGDSGDQAGEATMIRSVGAKGYIITAVRAGNGNLKLISWGISPDGDLVSRLTDSKEQAGEISGHALMRRGPGVLSAVRTSNGNLKLIAWEVSRSGWIARAGDSYNLAGEASLITLFGTGPIVTPVRTAGDNLKLITWNDEPCVTNGQSGPIASTPV